VKECPDGYFAWQYAYALETGEEITGTTIASRSDMVCNYNVNAQTSSKVHSQTHPPAQHLPRPDTHLLFDALISFLAKQKWSPEFCESFV
jgi:hypothetical protein